MATVYKLNVGDEIPFFSLDDDQGRTINSDSLYGSPYVIYFYPKDDTPGCTTEACSFRDAIEKFDDLKIPVLGVSPDPIESHQEFKKKYGINFPLLTDTDHKLADAFDVWKERNMYGNKFWGVLRTTFLVSPTGKIIWLERPVKVDGHVERLLNAIRIYLDNHPLETE